MYRRILVALVLVVSLFALGARPAGAAEPADLVRSINMARLGAGLEPLTEDPGLARVADAWAAEMAATGSLRHRTDLATATDAAVGTSWTAVSENVGRGRSIGSLHDSFMASPTHRANVLGRFTRVGVGVRVVGTTVWVAVNFLQAPEICGRLGFETPGAPAWLLGPDGAVAAVDGAAPTDALPSRDLVAAAARHGGGVWAAGGDGGVFTLGGAPFLGSLGGTPISERIVDLVATPSGDGYRLIGARGGVFTYGDADFHGSAASLRLRAPVVAAASTPGGSGYWLLGRDGGVFTFGDAAFFGSLGDRPPPHPAVALVPTPSGRGYWIIARDGGVFSFGDAAFHGSPAELGAPSPMVDAVGTATGYVIVDADGRRWAYGAGGRVISTPTCRPTSAVALRA